MRDAGDEDSNLHPQFVTTVMSRGQSRDVINMWKFMDLVCMFDWTPEMLLSNSVAVMYSVGRRR